MSGGVAVSETADDACGLPLFWRFQLTGMFVLGCTNVLYCLGIIRGAGPALAVAFVSLALESAVTLLLRAYYHRLARRRVRDAVLLTHIVALSGLGGLASDKLVALFVEATGFLPTASTPATRLASIGSLAMIYLTWSLLYFGIKRTREAQRARELLHETQILAARAEVAMLRYQVNPHFLFNSLASLRQQIIEDAGKARQMTTELAGYLRYTLARTDAQLDAVQKYLAVERARFEERLVVAFEIEPRAREALVPPFMLQPLVENALKHGAPQNGGRLELRIRAQHPPAGPLRLEVANSGRWITPAIEPTPGCGIGLANVRRRLENLFPGCHAFGVEEAGGFTTVRIEIGAPSIPTEAGAS